MHSTASTATKPFPLSKSFGFARPVAAVLALWVAAGSAEAVVVVRPSAGFDVQQFSTSYAFGLDIDGDAIPDLQLRGEGTDDISFDRPSFSLLSLNTADSPQIRLYQPGDLIRYDGLFSDAIEPNDPWVALTNIETTAYVGVKFLADYPAAPEQLLGYFSLAYDPALDVLHVANIAYETQPQTDLRIAPEPTAGAVVAVGLVGLARCRRSAKRKL